MRMGTMLLKKHQVPVEKKEETLAEKFSKVKFRQLEMSQNVRMNINQGDQAEAKAKRDRANNYWKDRVSQDFLPPID